MNYNIYYKIYIGYKSNKYIVSNKNLITPINKNYTYLVIITEINNEWRNNYIIRKLK